MKLDKTEVDFFNENGYLIINDFFNLDELNDFKNTVRSVIRSTLVKASKIHKDVIMEDFIGKEFGDAISKLEEIDNSFIADIYDTISYTPSFLRLVSKRKTSDVVNQIFNRSDDAPLYAFTNRCRIDPPKVTRRSTNWHQEIFYTIPESEFLQTWGPLISDITKENGAIEICVGSHKEGIANQFKNSEKGNPTPYVVDNNLISKYEQKTIEMKLGDLLFFSPKLFHKSGNNSSNEVRYTIIGMYHNIDHLTFRSPNYAFHYKGKSPEEYYDEFMQRKNH